MKQFFSDVINLTQLEFLIKYWRMYVIIIVSPLLLFPFFAIKDRIRNWKRGVNDHEPRSKE